MTDLSDLDVFDPPAPARAGAAPARTCRRHVWVGIACIRCNRPRDEAAIRRGRNNRQRGNAIERDIAKALGLKRVGQYGGPDDVSGELFVAQVKSGGAFPERLWSWLKALPQNAAQTPLLVVTDAPGPGHKRRALVILDLDDWRDLHGETL